MSFEPFCSLTVLQGRDPRRNLSNLILKHGKFLCQKSRNEWCPVTKC